MAPAGDNFKKYLRFSSLGLELGLSVGAGVALGLILDRFFDTRPWLLLLFSFAGIGAGFMSVYRTLKRLHREMIANRSQEENPPP